jgi:hypothetical protein
MLACCVFFSHVIIFLSIGQIKGKSATVVAGSVCLAHPMQLAQAAKIHTSDQREDVVDAATLKDLTQVSVTRSSPESLERHFLKNFECRL